MSTFFGPRRDRFTIAHELGHYFLHSEEGQRPIIVNRGGSGRVEWEANWFAAAFLMPAEEFRRLIRGGMSTSGLAAHFGVSEQAAAIRRQALGAYVAGGLRMVDAPAP